MRGRIQCSLQVGKRLYNLFINCDVDHTDLRVIDNNRVSIYCNQPSIDVKCTHKDYEKAFKVSQDGDYHLLVEFKKQPENIRVYSQYNEYNGPNWLIYISGKLKPSIQALKQTSGLLRCVRYLLTTFFDIKIKGEGIIIQDMVSRRTYPLIYCHIDLILHILHH